MYIYMNYYSQLFQNIGVWFRGGNIWLELSKSVFMRIKPVNTSIHF